MKKFVVLTLVLMLFAASSYAIDFAPTPMVISAPGAIQYNFDGSELEIPVQLTGTPASAMLLVYTKDMGPSISHVLNGYLGWHYVNKIDTCIYAGEPSNYDIGNNTIKWNGMDNDGNKVDAGEYTYYIWGYDNITFKIPMTRSIHPKPWGKLAVVSHDEDGSPKNNPYIIQSSGARHKLDAIPGAQENKKWIIGGDPEDSSLLETCMTYGATDAGETGIYPKNHSYFFKGGNDGNNNFRCYAWTWVPNGDAEKRTDWGEDGEFSYSIMTGEG
ncbi:unnamed protein product, partial [marine sediment metagenome]